MKKYYIRFGEIPINEKSKIHKYNEVIGKEKGVSVYDCYLKDNKHLIVVPMPCKECTIDTIHGLILKVAGYKSNTRVLLVTGKEVGIGTDGEPLIKNIKIIKDITDEYKNYID